jgi:hypothetical protein
VDAFLRERTPDGPPISPRLDLSVRGVVPLAGRGLDDLPAIGAKAAQLAELAHVVTSCGPVPLPAEPFAIAIVHSVEHFERSGARTRLDELLDDPAFRADPSVRAQGLSELRALIMDTQVDAALLAEVDQAIAARFSNRRVRLRSSSNTEDLPGFNGAGLYRSVGVERGDPERSIADGLRAVWASLWSPRAYDERELARIDQSRVAMGVLVHEAFRTERANAVAISRNALEPTRSDEHYVNAQIGEASVANPAPGVTTEEFVHRHRRSGPAAIEYQRRSSLAQGKDVLVAPEIAAASCHLNGIHAHFQDRLDPEREQRWFTADVELKLLGEERTLLFKQARPYAFGKAEIPADCREY